MHSSIDTAPRPLRDFPPRMLPNLPLRRWVIYAAINLFIVSLLGVLLRYKAVFGMPVPDYNYLLHAHSHFAFSGWVTTALFAGLLHILAESGVRLSRAYRYQFWLNQLSSFGMLASFIVQGYGPVSIVFSSLSVVFSYWFALSYWRDAKNATWPPVVRRAIGFALFYLVLSSLGPFLLAYSMSHHLGDRAFYYNAIYLYLHFQYNGWFTFGVLALFLWWAFRAGGGRDNGRSPGEGVARGRIRAAKSATVAASGKYCGGVSAPWARRWCRRCSAGAAPASRRGAAGRPRRRRARPPRR